LLGYQSWDPQDAGADGSANRSGEPKANAKHLEQVAIR